MKIKFTVIGEIEIDLHYARQIAAMPWPMAALEVGLLLDEQHGITNGSENLNLRSLQLEVASATIAEELKCAQNPKS